MSIILRVDGLLGKINGTVYGGQVRCYPNFFRKPGKHPIASQIFEDSEQVTRDKMTPFDDRGIECGDGWFGIIDRLSKACEVEIKMLIDLGLHE